MVCLQRWHGWCHMKLLPSRRVLCTPYNHAPCHFMQSHMHLMHNLAVTSKSVRFHLLDWTGWSKLFRTNLSSLHTPTSHALLLLSDQYACVGLCCACIYTRKGGIVLPLFVKHCTHVKFACCMLCKRACTFGGNKLFLLWELCLLSTSSLPHFFHTVHLPGV